MEVELHANAVLIRSAAFGRDVVVAECGISVVVDLSVAWSTLPTLPVEVEYLRMRLVEEVAGEYHSVDATLVAERIDGEHMVKLVGLGWQVEMQVGCYDDGAVCLSLLLRRVAVEG